MSKKSGQLNVSITAEQAAFIEAVALRHKTSPPELIRGLIDAAAEFYAAHGWFSFPVKIQPEMFQDPTSTGATRGANVTAPHVPGSVENGAGYSSELNRHARKQYGPAAGETARELSQAVSRKKSGHR